MSDKENQQKITANFTKDEFLCPCGDCPWSHPEIDHMVLVDHIFIVTLQYIREDLGFPLKITSGARCQSHNDDIGGAKKSGHLVYIDHPAKAADISTQGMTSEMKYQLVRSALKHGIRGLGIANGFIHIDRKKRSALWTY